MNAAKEYSVFTAAALMFHPPLFPVPMVCSRPSPSDYDSLEGLRGSRSAFQISSRCFERLNFTSTCILTWRVKVDKRTAATVPLRIYRSLLAWRAPSRCQPALGNFFSHGAHGWLMGLGGLFPARLTWHLDTGRAGRFPDRRPEWRPIERAIRSTRASALYHDIFCHVLRACSRRFA